MTARTCKCGCGASLAGRRSDCVFATSTCGKEYSRGESAAQRGRRGPGGLQVSYWAAVEEVYQLYRYLRPMGDRHIQQIIAEDAVAKRLPARQRARLEARR